MNPAGRLMLDRSGLLPSIVLMQAAFQKDEGSAIFLYLCSSSTSLDPSLSNKLSTNRPSSH